MASGPEHYKSAELILQEIAEKREELEPLEISLMLEAANVHAKLAQAAAMAIKTQTPGEANSWRGVCRGVRE